MREILKLAFAGAAGLVMVASAQAATTYNFDLIIGVTTGSGNDLEFDLGRASSLVNGETWSSFTPLVSSYLSQSFKWGVIGNTGNGVGGTANNDVFSTTTALPAPGANQTIYNSVYNATKGIYGLFPAPGGAGESANPSATGLANSWFNQTINGAGSTTYKNSYNNPNSPGIGTIPLWDANTQAGGAVTEFGTFTLDANGGLTFNTVQTVGAVPEPATCGAFAGLGLLVLALRRTLGVHA